MHSKQSFAVQIVAVERTAWCRAKMIKSEVSKCVVIRQS